MRRGASMTRKQNRFFLILGLAGLVSLFAMHRVHPSMFKDGFHVTAGNFAVDVFPYFFMGTFISLTWFWLMPILGTDMYLKGRFDHPRYQYMYTWPIYRFIFLIHDDPRVVAKKRGAA